MEAFYGLVRRLVESFDRFDVDYMFTGALAVSFYGVPRTTVDVDVVVAVSRESLSKLVSALKQAGLAVEERIVTNALESDYKIATFKDGKTPYRVDIIFSDKGKLEKRAGTVAGLKTFYQTPEDLILGKLRMIKATLPRERALKDEEDVRAILEFAGVDVEVVKKRAKSESTLALFDEIMS